MVLIQTESGVSVTIAWMRLLLQLADCCRRQMVGAA